MFNIVCIDVGTSNIKFLLSLSTGERIEAKAPVLMHQAEDQSYYQLADEILASIKQQLTLWVKMGYVIDCIAFSVPMHTLIIEEKMLLWSDNRASSWIEDFKASGLARTFYHSTGTPIHPMSPFAKIGAYLEQNPQNTTCSFMGLKEFLMQYFVGENLIDYSTASTTGLFDIHELDWSSEILKYLGISQMNLAKLVKPCDLFQVSSDAMDELGLPHTCQVMMGAVDGVLASYAGDELYHNQEVVSIGTSGAVRKMSHHIELSDSDQTFCYYLSPERWVIGGPTNNGGNVLRWLGQLLYENETSLYSAIPKALKQVPPGAEGLNFSPYLFGERAPLWDTSIGGAFTNIKSFHKKEHFIRAAIEGILTNIFRIMEGVTIGDQVIVNGGVFQIPEIVDVAEQIWDKEVILGEQSEPNDGLLLLATKTIKT